MSKKLYKEDWLLFRKTKNSRWAVLQIQTDDPSYSALVFAGHIRCSGGVPRDFRGNYISWTPEDVTRPKCYRCHAPVPKEIQALVLLYGEGTRE